MSTPSSNSPTVPAAEGSPQNLRRLAVFCGSNSGTDPVFAETARRLGQLMLDRGERANVASSQAKVAVSEAVWRIADRSVQLLGGLGVSDETVVAQIFKDIRPFRIYDGPSEVHRWSLGRRIARREGPVPT